MLRYIILLFLGIFTVIITVGILEFVYVTTAISTQNAGVLVSISSGMFALDTLALKWFYQTKVEV